VVTVDLARAAAAVAELLRAVGEDPDRPGLERTPERVAAATAELLAGTGTDPAALLRKEAALAHDPEGPVVLRGIPFRSTCEHHLLPFAGTATIVYLPADRVAGLGTLVRVVEAAAARLQLQERLTEDIAEAVQAGLGAQGVLVVTEATQACVWARGTRARGVVAGALAARGRYREGADRQEALLLAGGPSGEAP
jgi:GTP cyclohydrolase I